jgi:large subunit ribosomal protein L10
MENKKVVDVIPKKKLKLVEELSNLIEKKRTILIADISNIPGSQFQQISKKLRGKAVVKVPKRNLFKRALDNSKKKKAGELMNEFKGAVAILFSDLDSYELAGVLLKNTSPAKAKPGQIAPRDLEVPEGPTELVPGPAISELGALGIQIMIKEGKIEIKAPKIVANSGKEISQKAADILSKLGIQPFRIGFLPKSAYDSHDDMIYTEIKIDSEGARESLSDAATRALAFAVSIGFVNSETVKIMIIKALGQERRLIRVINGEPEEELVVEEAPSAEENKPEEKKEEPANTDFAAGFF